MLAEKFPDRDRKDSNSKGGRTAWYRRVRKWCSSVGDAVLSLPGSKRAGGRERERERERERKKERGREGERERGRGREGEKVKDLPPTIIPTRGKRERGTTREKNVMRIRAEDRFIFHKRMSACEFVTL